MAAAAAAEAALYEFISTGPSQPFWTTGEKSGTVGTMTVRAVLLKSCNTTSQMSQNSMCKLGI